MFAMHDRTVYVVHNPNKDVTASPLPNEFPDAESALTKSGRTRNNRVVSKVMVEQIDGTYRETEATADRTVFVLHYPDKNPTESPLMHQFSKAEDAFFKKNSGKGGEWIVSKITVERVNQPES